MSRSAPIAVLRKWRAQSRLQVRGVRNGSRPSCLPAHAGDLGASVAAVRDLDSEIVTLSIEQSLVGTRVGERASIWSCAGGSASDSSRPASEHVRSDRGCSRAFDFRCWRRSSASRDGRSCASTGPVRRCRLKLRKRCCGSRAPCFLAGRYGQPAERCAQRHRNVTAHTGSPDARTGIRGSRRIFGRQVAERYG